MHDVSIRVAGKRRTGRQGDMAQDRLPSSFPADGKLFYTAEDFPGERYLRDLSFPGLEPFTRGIDAAMYRKGRWQITQCLGLSAPTAVNSRIRYLLANGINGFGLILDARSNMGLDPVKSRRGKDSGEGLSLSSLADMKRLLSSVSPTEISPCFHVNSAAPQIMSMYLAACASKNIGPENIGGMIQNDPIEDMLMGTKSDIAVADSMKLSAALIDYCLDNAPHFTPLCVSGYMLREYGGSVVHEIAFVLSSALAHLESAEKNGIEPERMLSTISFVLGVGTDVPVEIAKFRAARRLWFKIIKARYPGISDSLARFRFTARSSDFALAGSEPEINTIRSTMQALASVLGGAQAIHVSNIKGRSASSNEAELRRELMLHRILDEESGVADTIDPTAGSYYAESLTDELEAKANSLIKHISGMGGMLNAISSGFVRSEIEKEAAQTHEKLMSGRKYVVGVNILGSERTHEGRRIAESAVGSSLRSAVSIAPRRSSRKSVSSLLDSLSSLELNDAGLIPAMIKTFLHGATLGEVSYAIYRRQSD